VAVLFLSNYCVGNIPTSNSSYFLLTVADGQLGKMQPGIFPAHFNTLKP
jgi:hypothetical protein